HGLTHVADAEIPYPHWRFASQQPNRVSLVHLMDLDNVAFWVIEEDLIPSLHRPGTVIRIGNALLVEPLFERLDIVSPESDVSAFQRVDDLLMLEADAQVLCRQMKLRCSIGHEGNLRAIALS